MARFVKPREDDDTEKRGGWQEERADVELTSGTTFIYNENLRLAVEEQRKRLPIYRARLHLLYLLQKYQTLIVVGETASGKSTQIPQYLYESGWCEGGLRVGLVEPRRVAATTLASRIALEKGCPLGSTVGYAIRFDDCTSDETRIKVMTEGLLLREMMSDPLLRSYSVIIVDEVHERTLLTDILLALLHKILKKRKALKVIVASATVDADKLKQFFNLNRSRDETKDTSSVLSLPGRLYPLNVFFTQEPVSDYVREAVDTVLKVHESAGDARGDILVFLPGQQDVDTAAQLLIDSSSPRHTIKLMVLPMYGSLSSGQQLKVFRPTPRGHRKVVVATNIAETSITVPGIVYVIDSGFVKVRWYDGKDRLERLVVVPVSKASARQRAGRAARLSPGFVYRLYTEEEYKKMREENVEEMLRSDLSGAVLNLKALGVDDMVSFSFPTSPPVLSVANGLELLHALDAIDGDGKLTKPLGFQMAEFPLTPRQAKALLSSHEEGCSVEMCDAMALLQVEKIFTNSKERRKFEVEEGDVLTALNVLTAWKRQAKDSRAQKAWARAHGVNHGAMLRAERLSSQARSLLSSLNVPLLSASGDGSKVRRGLVRGFFSQAAVRQSGVEYRSLCGGSSTPLIIHPDSTLYSLHPPPQWVIYCETVQGPSGLHMKDITAIESGWLLELAPHYYRCSQQIRQP